MLLKTTELAVRTSATLTARQHGLEHHLLASSLLPACIGELQVLVALTQSWAPLLFSPQEMYWPGILTPTSLQGSIPWAKLS